MKFDTIITTDRGLMFKYQWLNKSEEGILARSSSTDISTYSIDTQSYHNTDLLCTWTIRALSHVFSKRSQVLRRCNFV